MEKKVVFRDRPESVSSPTLRMSFNELVMCGMCGFKLTKPKMLSCQHTFCLACLRADAKRISSNESYQCTTCKSSAPVTDFKDLPDNIHVNNLLDILQVPHSDDHVSLTRQISVATAETTAVRCNKCEVLLSISSPGPSSALSGAVDGKSEKSIKCKHCKLYYCPVCWTIHMEQLRDQFQAFDAQLNLVRQRLQKKSDQFETRLVQCEENISSFFARKIEKLKLKEDKLLAEARQMMQPEREKLSDIRSQISSFSKSLQRNQTDLGASLDRVFLDKHSEISRVIRSVNLWGESKLKFDDSLGSLELDTSHLKARLSESEESPEMEIKRKVYKVKLTWNRCPHPMGVCEAPWKDELVDDQLIYVAGSDSKMVIGIERRKGRVVRKIQRSAMEYPHSIAISGDREEIIVSDKWANYIFVFNKEGGLLRVLGDKGEDFGSLRSPEGLAMDGNVLYVCDTGNDRVQGFDLNTGDALFQFGNIKRESKGGVNKTKIVDLNAPTSISIHKERIFILDSTESRIKVFSKTTLAQIGEFGKQGSAPGQFNQPDGIAVDECGMIYVGDGNARIQVFDKKLEFLRTIGTRGTGNGQFTIISGLCVTTNNELVVSDFKNHTVQILQ